MQPLPENAAARRFAPPAAEVEDVSAGVQPVQPVRLWPPRGRIGRLRFFVYGIGAWLANIVFAGGLGLAAGIGGARPEFASLVSIAAYAVLASLIVIQRSHDMNLTGWASLLVLVPFVGLFWLFKRGTPVANRFGAPPPPNSAGLVALGWIAGGLMALAFAAVMAVMVIPAYALLAR